MPDQIHINSPDVKYTETHIESRYRYQTTAVRRDGGTLTRPTSIHTRFHGGYYDNRLIITILKKSNKKQSLFGAWLGCGVIFGTAMCSVSGDTDNGTELQYHRSLVGRSAVGPEPFTWTTHLVCRRMIRLAEHDIMTKRTRAEVEQIRADIRDFLQSSGVDKVIVLWTANTERFCDVTAGVNDTAENLLATIQRGGEVSPSTLFAVASIQEGCAYINGSPQNTFVPGAVELAVQKGVFVGGDDFKSGQTKIKSVLVDFLVSAGIKPASIVSYNHLGNNDGMNLSAPQQFRSKEISKSNVVDDMVRSNPVLYRPGEKPDHCVVIKYVPYVGDSKRAMDEYTSEIMMGGANTLAIHNTCEDSLLASPIILDLVLMTELCQRVAVRPQGEEDFQSFHSVLALLSFFCKAPLMPPGAPLVNAFFRQRAAIENIMSLPGSPPPEPHAPRVQTPDRVPAPAQPPPRPPPPCNGLANGSKAAAAAALLRNGTTHSRATNGHGAAHVSGDGSDNDVEI
ncbi:unnamed protein product [Merluccius merluccius]